VRPASSLVAQPAWTQNTFFEVRRAAFSKAMAMGRGFIFTAALKRPI